MKQTLNRKLILRLLDESIADCGGRPPYRAIDLHYAIHFQGFDEWYAEQDGTAKPNPLNLSHINWTASSPFGKIVI